MNPMISPAKPGGRLARDRGAVHREHQDGGPDDLGGEPDGQARIRVDRDGAEPELGRIVAGQDDQGQAGADERADSWATMYPPAVLPSIWRVSSSEIVTAGLMWQPLMWPTE